MDGSITALSKYRFYKSFSKLIDKSFRLREKADYEDFYVITSEEALSQLEKARIVVSTIESYLKQKWNNL